MFKTPPHIFPWMKPKEPENKNGYTKESKAGFYDSPEWRNLAKAHKKQNPLCVICLAEKQKLTPVKITDHIIPVDIAPQLALDWDNLQSLCDKCHRLKTRADNSKYNTKNINRGKNLMQQFESE